MAKPNTTIALKLAPNPANSGALVSYQYSNDATAVKRTLELYDVLGRRLAAYDAGQESGGVWNLNLSSVAPGNYQVVMKDGGKVVSTARLTVTR